MNVYEAERLLGVTKPYTHTDVKKKYREYAKVNHPDMNGIDNSFAKGVEAYELLKDFLDNPYKYAIEQVSVIVPTSEGYQHAFNLLHDNRLVPTNIKFYSILDCRLE